MSVMLRYFSCENLYSYGGRAVLSMIADEKKENEENPDFLYDKEGKRILRVASIYGPNASGKSNILKAMESMLRNIVESPNVLQGEPCYLQKGTVPEIVISPRQCEIEVLIDDTVYRYEYLINDSVLAESLLQKDSSDSKFKVIFTREDIKVDYKGSDEAVNGLVATVAKSKRNLFLHLAGKTSAKPFCDIFEWCKQAMPSLEISKLSPSLDMDRNREIVKKYIEKLNDKDFKAEFLKFIKKFDPTISEITTSSFRKNKGVSVSEELFVWRKRVGDSEIGFDFARESDGTRRIFELYIPLKTVLDAGALFVIDELDLRLHPWIVRELIRIFHDPAENENNAQMILSAHSTASLNSKDLRMDEIYFVERVHGFSEIARLNTEGYPFEKFQDCDDFGRHYLLGRFGAVPEGFSKEEHNVSDEF